MLWLDIAFTALHFDCQLFSGSPTEVIHSEDVLQLVNTNFFEAGILSFLPSTKSLVPRPVPSADICDKKKGSHSFYIPTYYSTAHEYQAIINLIIVIITLQSATD